MIFGEMPPVEVLIGIVFALFFGIGLHEFAHCKFADMAGDPTPSFYGRVTLNLTKHFEPAGTLMMVFTALSGFGIGWGKPAPMDPRKMRNPRWDFFLAVIAGPMSNVVQAVVYALVFRLMLSGAPQLLEGAQDFSAIGMILIYGVMINMSLAVFNMVPLGPLDGHWLVGLLMPEKQRHYWFMWNRNYGRIVLLAVVLLGQYMRRTGLEEFDLFGRFVFPMARGAANYLLGHPIFH